MFTFDFNDGNGPVPAHKHPNGGGWVADTAKVDETAFVGRDAMVYGDAMVYDNARVYGDARVHSDAQVYGDARVGGKVRVHGDTCDRLTGRAEKSDTNEDIFIEMNGKRYKLVRMVK
jgi:UDP-3-O-[3-hydroxymyristoyl] glucosamine N-acyltransferase